MPHRLKLTGVPEYRESFSFILHTVGIEARERTLMSNGIYVLEIPNEV